MKLLLLKQVIHKQYAAATASLPSQIVGFKSCCLNHPISCLGVILKAATFTSTATKKLTTLRPLSNWLQRAAANLWSKALHDSHSDIRKRALLQRGSKRKELNAPKNRCLNVSRLRLKKPKALWAPQKKYHSLLSLTRLSSRTPSRQKKKKKACYWRFSSFRPVYYMWSLTRTFQPWHGDSFPDVSANRATLSCFATSTNMKADVLERVTTEAKSFQRTVTFMLLL